jgi:hypothetical protein
MGPYGGHFQLHVMISAVGSHLGMASSAKDPQIMNSIVLSLKIGVGMQKFFIGNSQMSK